MYSTPSRMISCLALCLICLLPGPGSHAAEASTASPASPPTSNQPGDKAAATPFDLLPPLVRKCPSLPREYVFDYRSNTAQALHWKKLVEGAHFTTSIRRGIAGNTAHLMGDLTYTLNHFPNHPFALSVTAEYQRRPGYVARRGTKRDYYWTSINCFFRRALSFAPTDPQVYHVIGLHFHKLQQHQRAEVFYQQALRLKPPIIEAHYNLGLLYLDMQQPARALPHAEIAYRGGYPMPGLKNRLAEAGFELKPEAASTDKVIH